VPRSPDDDGADGGRPLNQGRMGGRFALGIAAALRDPAGP
jgi:hypothetical protein